MKKIAILLIILLITSIGFANSCTAGKEPCGACDGTGECGRCGGSGLGLEWDLQCDRCDGTGFCPTCGGSGYIDTGIGGTGVPGFELIIVICALALVLFWKRKKI